MEYRLLEVTSKREERIFLDMVEYIYQNDKNWVRTFDSDIENTFNPAKNKLFKTGEAKRWILVDQNNKAVGRIAAFYNTDPNAQAYCQEGGCGFFECIDDQEAANIMFTAAIEWLESKGVEAVDGSINFGARDQFWGVLVEGFHPPMYGSNYNLPYYGKLFENFGFQNYFNQHSYVKELQAGSVNPAVLEKAQRLKENPDFEFRSVRKDEIDKIATMFRTVYNKAWSKFEGVAEMTQEQADHVLEQLKPIMDIEIIIFAFYKGEPIGFFITIPDINPALKPLKGKFGIIEKLRFIYKLKFTKSCNAMQAIVFGVDPEFQGKGIESGMIMVLSDKVKENTLKYNHLELVWIGDFNPLMIRMVEGYVCATKYKQFITYRYMINKDIEFKRHPRVSISRNKR